MRVDVSCTIVVSLSVNEVSYVGTLVPLCLSYDQKLFVFCLCVGTVTLSYVIIVHDDYNSIRHNIQKEIIIITNSWF